MRYGTQEKFNFLPFFYVTGCQTTLPRQLKTEKNLDTIVLRLKLNKSSGDNSSDTNHTMCKWLITASQERLVSFRFSHFKFSPPGSYLLSHDGMDNTAGTIRNITAASSNWLTSSGRYLFLSFISADQIINGTLEMMFQEKSNIGTGL